MVTIMDKIQLQKYIYLISQFLLGKIEGADFEKLFFQVRREDPYLMESKFSPEVGKILDTFTLDANDYTIPELYDPNDKYDIDEEEFKKRAKKTLEILESFINFE